MSFDWNGRRALVTGAHGFLAAHLVPALLAQGAQVRAAVRRPQPLAYLTPGHAVDVRVLDLGDRAALPSLLDGVDVVFHLAAVGWGFHENARRQPELFTENVLLNSSVLDAAHHAGVGRFLLASSSAVYRSGDLVLSDAVPWDGEPHAGEAGFGWAKRAAEVQARLYAERHGMRVAIVRPSNPYGSWDNFDPATSHVIPALIRRALSGERPFVVWGTGRPIRSFIHARDVARGMLAAVERVVDGTAVNLSSPQGTAIADLVRLVLRACGRDDGDIVFDTTKPDGPASKVPDATRMRERLGLNTLTSLEEGLAETVAWYRAQGHGHE
jgi:GDP-L-fucose synthase